MRASIELQRRARQRLTLAELEAEYVRETLAATKGNKAAAARLLGISRKNLYEKLARYERDEG
jgi:DNA-binding NtrC family response regulator